jgi:hypothetical protein
MVGGEGGLPRYSVAPERIPAAFSEEGTETIELSREGDNEFNFDITSAAKK